MVQHARQQPQHNPVSSSGVEIIAIASTMFAIFFGVWWGTMLTAVNEKSKSSGDIQDYQAWLTDSAFLAAALVVILSLHALVVAHIKVIPPSGIQLWGEIGIVLVLGGSAIHLAGTFLDDTAHKFGLDDTIQSTGITLLRYWLAATWILVAIVKVYSEFVPLTTRTIGTLWSMLPRQQGV